jgi:hypothetical protein
MVRDVPYRGDRRVKKTEINIKLPTWSFRLPFFLGSVMICSAATKPTSAATIKNKSYYLCNYPLMTFSSSHIIGTNTSNNNTMPKEQKKVKIGHSSRHAPLGQVIQDDDNRGKYATSKRVISSAASKKHDDEHEEELLDERTSKKILELGRLQQQEMMQEEEAAAARNILSNEKFGGSSGGNSGKKQKQKVKRRDDDDDDSSDADSDDEDFNEEDLLVEEDDKGYVTMSSTIGLTPDEEALLSNMMGGNNDDEMPERRNLADIIMAKIEEKEAGVNMNQDGDEEEMVGMELPPKVVQVSSHT